MDEYIKKSLIDIHGYDSVTKEFLWGLVVKHIPALLNDVNELLQ